MKLNMSMCIKAHMIVYWHAFDPDSDGTVCQITKWSFTFTLATQFMYMFLSNISIHVQFLVAGNEGKWTSKWCFYKTPFFMYHFLHNTWIVHKSYTVNLLDCNTVLQKGRGYNMYMSAYNTYFLAYWHYTVDSQSTVTERQSCRTHHHCH